MTRKVHWVVAAVLALLTTSCGAYVGPNAMVPLSGGEVPVGVTAGYSAFPDSSQGVVLGGGVSFAPPGEGTDRQARGWADVTVGYGVQPVPDGPHLGFEGKLGPAAGILPDDGGYPFALGWVYEVDALYRVSHTRRPWELGDHVLTYGLLVPSVQVAQLIPANE